MFSDNYSDHSDNDSEGDRPDSDQDGSDREDDRSDSEGNRPYRDRDGSDNEALCCRTLGCDHQMSCEYEAKCSRLGCLMCRRHCRCVDIARLYSSKSKEWRGMRQTTRGMGLQQQLHTQIQTPNERMFYAFIFGPDEEIEEIEDVNLLDLDYENPTDEQLEVYNRQR